MRKSLHIASRWVLSISLCLMAAPLLAGHLPEGTPAYKGPRADALAEMRPRPSKAAPLSGKAARETGGRRNGAPSPNAQFNRMPDCGSGCAPPGQLLDFGTGQAGSGPPGNLPSRPEPVLIVTPLPQSAGMLLAGLAVLAAFAANRRRRHRA